MTIKINDYQHERDLAWQSKVLDIKGLKSFFTMATQVAFRITTYKK